MRDRSSRNASPDSGTSGTMSAAFTPESELSADPFTPSSAIDHDAAMAHLKAAMIWSEEDGTWFHQDAYHFGRTLLPHLTALTQENLERLVEWLEHYEEYRVSNRGIYAYTVRDYYMKDRHDEPLFRSTDAVKVMVGKQSRAHQAGVLVTKGWQQAMREADIWDDDKTVPGVDELRRMAETPVVASSGIDLDAAAEYLKTAMVWDEEDGTRFHQDAYHFARTLVPHMRVRSEENLDRLVTWLKGYEEYKSDHPTILPYYQREWYVKDRYDKTLFMSTHAVEVMVRKQVHAYRAGREGESGWQQAMTEANIADDRDEVPGVQATPDCFVFKSKSQSKSAAQSDNRQSKSPPEPKVQTRAEPQWLRDYHVVIVTALPPERAAVSLMFDQSHRAPQDYVRSSFSENIYDWGRIGEHNVAVASHELGDHGEKLITDAVFDLTADLPHVRLALIVGMGAGLAATRLGHVVISRPSGRSGGLKEFLRFVKPSEVAQTQLLRSVMPRAVDTRTRGIVNTNWGGGNQVNIVQSGPNTTQYNGVNIRRFEEW